MRTGVVKRCTEYRVSQFTRHVGEDPNRQGISNRIHLGFKESHSIYQSLAEQQWSNHHDEPAHDGSTGPCLPHASSALVAQPGRQRQVNPRGPHRAV